MGLLTTPAVAFDPATEASNFSKGQERQAIYATPAYQTLLTQTSTQNEIATTQIRVSDPGRSFQNNACARDDGPCAGDVRLYNWQRQGYGIVDPVLFTARDGATISGHVWATRAGPSHRPGVVITAGSVQADEQMYWYAAQALAKAGYVVLTWDPQGQGQSDTDGEGVDQNEGVPAQTDGRPFFDGTEDALNFFLATPVQRYEPVPSCSTGTSHRAKQDERVRVGLDAGYNPFWMLLDASRVGLVGHSLGATGVSYIGQWDPRVKTIVAWDNLRNTNPSGYPGATGITSGGMNPAGELGCPATPADRTIPAVTKPALGMSADYFLPPTPNTSDPDPLSKSPESLAYTKAGQDTGEIIIRGGTHLDFSWIPNQAFPATLRGADEISWYTTAWFDRYLKGEPTANARLLTDRWRRDASEAAVDPGRDGNAFSFYYRSRLDLHTTDGRAFDCEDLRAGCPGLVARDGFPGDYSYLAVDTTPDGPADTARVPADPVGLRPGYAGTPTCHSARRVVLHLRARAGLTIAGISASSSPPVRLIRSSGHRIIVNLVGLPRQTVHVTIRMREHSRATGTTVTVVRRLAVHTCRPGRRPTSHTPRDDRRRRRRRGGLN